MNEAIQAIIVVIAISLFMGGLLWFVMIYGPSQVDKLEDLSCESLLKSIQDEGIKPNYQFDVRAWVGKECWK